MTPVPTIDVIPPVTAAVDAATVPVAIKLVPAPNVKPAIPPATPPINEAFPTDFQSDIWPVDFI